MRTTENAWATGSMPEGLSCADTPGDVQTTIEVKSATVVIQLRGKDEPIREADEPDRAETRRDMLCGLCEKLVCLKLDISLEAMRAKTRSRADVALARQIAMYLAHTSFSVLMTEVGLHFCRDRTTVAHACALVEDRRDDFVFDTLLCQLEDALAHTVDCADPARMGRYTVKSDTAAGDGR